MGKEAQVSSAESWAQAREPPAAGRGQGRTRRRGRRGFTPRPQSCPEPPRVPPRRWSRGPGARWGGRVGAQGSPAQLGEPPKVTRVAEPGDTEVSEELRPVSPGLEGPRPGAWAHSCPGNWSVASRRPGGRAGGCARSGSCGSGGSQTAVCLPSHRGRSPPSWEAESRALPFSRFQIPNREAH